MRNTTLGRHLAAIAWSAVVGIAAAGEGIAEPARIGDLGLVRPQLPLQLAALGSVDGSGPSCAKDGQCNLAVCDADPDCPEGVAESANTNSPGGEGGSSVSSIDEIALRVQFNLTQAAAPDSTGRKRALQKIWRWIDEAEAIYAGEPRLKIVPFYRYDTLNVPTTFDRARHARRFMKEHYDNIVGDTKGRGKLVVAVTASNSTIINDPSDPSDDIELGGFAYFPDSVRPLGLKHGIALNINKADASFAHELGHIFGLKHTNDSDAGVFNRNCNKDFSQGETATTRVGSRVNLMDGQGLLDGDDVWLNSCQKEKAAAHRDRLLTKDGKTNYAKL